MNSWIRGIAVSVILCVCRTVIADVEWVTVGDAGNVPDTRYATPGYGGVPYAYRIGKCEVTNNQYAEFLNAVAALGDPNSLYNTSMGGGWFNIGGISRTGSGTPGNPWVYAARSNRGNRPVNYVSWHDALRFANWMHNGKPAGVQDDSTTEDGAYDMSLGSSVVRKPGALVFLPTEDEWYKAAYYKGGSINAGYWDYPTESNTVPTAEAPPGTELLNGSANHEVGGYVNPTYFTTEAGAYNTQNPPGSGTCVSDSAYGTFDQGGNLWEWNETDVVGDGSRRGLRGGSFDHYLGFGLIASFRTSFAPYVEGSDMGFRVAAAPEQEPIPTVSEWGLAVLMLLIVTAGVVAILRRPDRPARA